MKKGFTLIELLVVVLIIGILAAIAVPQYEFAVEKSRAAEPLAVLKSIREAQELYFMSNGQYATDLSELDIPAPTGQHFNYRWAGISVAAYSKKKPYLLAYRTSDTMSKGGANTVCGTDSGSASDIEYAKRICNAWGADTSKGGGQGARWTIVK